MMRQLAAGLLFAVALAAYGHGAMHTPLLDARRGEAVMLAQRTVAMAGQGHAEEIALAEAYWRRNPDVAADRFFGRAGILSPHGAREHWSRHGRREGRRWGLD